VRAGSSPIGEESSERYEFIKAQVIVIEDVCKKYACAKVARSAIGEIRNKWRRGSGFPLGFQQS
jgi:transposase